VINDYQSSKSAIRKKIKLIDNNRSRIVISREAKFNTEINTYVNDNLTQFEDISQVNLQNGDLEIKEDNDVSSTNFHTFYQKCKNEFE